MSLRLRFRFLVASVASAASVASLLAACGSADDLSLGPGGADAGRPDGFADGAAFGDAAPIELPATGIVVVHAASFGAFRVCFDTARQTQPFPSADLMPESNLVGVDVGSVVRIDPLPTPPGRIWIFGVDDITPFYPPGRSGPTCDELLGGSASQFGIEVGTVQDDLSSGVHLLVLSGCASATIDPSASVARCGDTWTPADGNLAMRNIALSAFARGGESELPVQVIPLSRDLSTRAVGVAFGALADGGVPDPFVEGDLPFGVPAPSQPHVLAFDPDDEASYASTGFFVTLGDEDAGARTVVLSQSLAEIQRLSAPRALPGEYYAAASSYVLLLLGDQAPGSDAGADAAADAAAAADERSMLHFLAVPLAAPDKTPRDAEAD